MKNYIKTAKNIVLNRDKPVSLIHFITNICNARCPHCFIDFDNQDSQREKMNLEDIDKLTRNMGPELLNVNITGGEPFYSPDIEEICKLYIKNTTINSIFFSTHGGPKKKIESFLKLIRSNPHITFIFSISVDHIGDKHSDYRKVKNLFESAMETYDLLKRSESNVKVVISITVSEFNCGDIDYIFDELVNKYKVDEITANIVRDEGVYKIPEKTKRAVLIGYQKLIERITEHNQNSTVKNYNLKTKIYNKMMQYKDDVMHREIAKTYLNPNFSLPCYAGGGLLGVIYPNGDVYPCEILENKKMGNLYDYEMNIQKLWKDNESLRDWIVSSKCNCTYECAWSYNILASKKHYPGLILSNFK